MKFTHVAIIALAAGAQAGAFKQVEPAAHHGRGIAQVVHTAITTGVRPIVTGVPGRNTTVPVISSSTRPVIPVSSPVQSSAVQSSAVQSSAVQSSAVQSSAAESSAAQSSAAQPSAAQPSAAQPSAAQPSASGFVPSSPGVKVTVPMVGAALGSVAYGALVFLA